MPAKRASRLGPGFGGSVPWGGTRTVLPASPGAAWDIELL